MLHYLWWNSDSFHTAQLALLLLFWYLYHNNRIDSGARLWNKQGSLTSQCLSFLICKWWTAQGLCEESVRELMGSFRMVPGFPPPLPPLLWGLVSPSPFCIGNWLTWCLLGKAQSWGSWIPMFVKRPDRLIALLWPPGAMLEEFLTPPAE